MTEQEIEQNGNCHYDVQSSIVLFRPRGLADGCARVQTILDSASKHAYTDSQNRFSPGGYSVKARFMRFGQVFLVAVLIFQALPRAVLADETHLGLGSALDRARMQNPQVAMAQARVSEAEGMRTQGSLIPNPSLYATSENTPLGGSQPFTFGNDTDDYVYLIQKVELGGKRGRRVAFATENVNQMSIQSEVGMQQLLMRVATAYWMAAGSAALDQLYKREVNTLDDIVDYNRARVQKGATAEADLIRIQLESDRLRAQARLAAEQARRSLVVLYREMGATAFPDSVIFTDRLDDLPEIRPPDLQTVLRDRLEMRAARERLKQAEANLNLQRANAWPDPQVMAGYKRFSGSGQFTGQNTLFFGFQVPLPIFDRNQGQIAVAQAEVQGAKGIVTDQEIAIRAQVSSALSDYGSRRQALLKVLPQMTRQAAASDAIAEGAYRLGGADILRFLDATRMDVETQVLFVQTLVDYHESVVNLELVTGMLR
jgi:cobalt-zinc-cadmium efflux system outer membrane protein